MPWTGHVARMEKSTDSYWVLVGKSEKRDHFEDLGVDGRIILKWIVKKMDENLKWINLGQDRDKWPAVVNALINFRVP